MAEVIAVRVTRFWALVQQGAEADCWPWTGYLEKDGYGQFFWGGRMRPAHELALTFPNGEVRADGLDTCHKCNNPPCCNPHHLRFDTRASNASDMVQSGRARRGSFTDEQIVVMRQRYANGSPQKILAADYNISNGLVSQIVRGLRYKRVGGPISSKNERYNHGK